MNRILKSYIYWTYPRGNFHYDVMVTLILAFIFITPHLWDYGDKPAVLAGSTQPILITGDGSHGLIITVQASDVNVGAEAPASTVKRRRGKSGSISSSRLLPTQFRSLSRACSRQKN
jgi:hypothetical protein